MQINGIEPDFWRDRRVFITGHTGFMGGWLSLWLDRLGANVAGYALAPPTQPSFFEATGLDQRISSTIADIRDQDRLTATLNNFAPDIVMHLAAQPLVGKAHADPAETFAVNTMGTVNLMQAIRTTPSVQTALIVTTDKVYENREWSWGYRESDTLGGHEPYGASKACAEFVVDAFRHSYFTADRTLGIATIRAGNIIGGGDWAANRLVPDAIQAFAKGEELVLRHPDAVRPWQHVLEPVRGYLILSQKLSAAPQQYTGPWNFGPPDSDADTVAEIADELVRLWGKSATWRHEAPPGDAATPKESRLLTVDSAKARSEIGWQPVWNLQRALSATVEWYRAHMDNRDMYTYSTRQIELAEGAN
jgi:CDP-glucose 4,6-dehydratase